MTEFTHIAPPEDGLRRAMADARRRRFRSAGLSTSATAVVIALAAAVAGAQGSQSLMQQKPVQEIPAVTGTHDDGKSTPDRGAASTTTTVTSVSTFTVTATTGTRTSTSGSQGFATVLSPPTSGRQGSAANTVKPYAPGDISRSENGIDVPSCTVDASHSQVANQLCPSTSESGASSPYQLYADICSTRTSTSLLHYAGRNDLDFAIYQGGRELWRWSRWHPDGGMPHTLSLGAGTCTSWALDWTAVDAHGKPLPAGNYTLRTTLLADELSGHNIYTYGFVL